MMRTRKDLKCKSVRRVGRFYLEVEAATTVLYQLILFLGFTETRLIFLTVQEIAQTITNQWIVVSWPIRLSTKSKSKCP